MKLKKDAHLSLRLPQDFRAELESWSVASERSVGAQALFFMRLGMQVALKNRIAQSPSGEL
jgi:hypothetical protein